MAVREVILVWELQHDGKQHQKFMHDVVMDVASKVLYFCPVGIDDLRLPPLECWDELGDVEDLCVVEDARLDFLQYASVGKFYLVIVLLIVCLSLSYSEAERLVPVVATILQVSPVRKLLVSREVEHGLSNGKLSIDLFLTQAEIGDIKEPDSLQGLEDLLS